MKPSETLLIYLDERLKLLAKDLYLKKGWTITEEGLEIKAKELAMGLGDDLVRGLYNQIKVQSACHKCGEDFNKEKI